MRKKCDLLVIGGGSGGVRAARRAAQAGARVIVAEEKYLGGTCVNAGCIPKKLFVYASHFGEMFADARGYGFRGADAAAFSWEELKRNKDMEISRLNGVYRNLLNDAGVEVVRARARFYGAKSISLDNEEVAADKILIAAGSIPARPPVDGAQFAAVSDDMFHLEQLPKRAIVAGGGYIACEFAAILAGLGVATTLLHRGGEVLKKFDCDIRRHIADELIKKEIKLKLNGAMEKIEKRADGGVLVYLKNGETLGADLILFATGRIPNTANLNLAAANIQTRADGAIVVDDNFQTSAPSVFALGDIIGRVALTPVAIAEAEAFVRRQFCGDNAAKVDYKNIPTAVFCRPPIGAVGMTEDEARAAGYKNIQVYKSVFRPLFHTLSGRDEKTLVKLVVNKEDDKILGAHIAGEGAGEIIQGVAIAIRKGATKGDFDSTIGVHPTTAEELVSLREAG
jgi:glutathione reductase (NADPH)